MAPTFFATPAAFGRWLTKHGRQRTELWIGFNKKGSGLGGMSYQQAVDEALAHGWIDGLVRRIDDARFMQRFTPRKPTSYWSAVNIAKVRRLEAEGRMTDAGRAAFARHLGRPAPYSHQSPPRELEASQLRALRANPAAWGFYRVQAPSYRKVVAYWIASAKREETRARRLAQLIACSADGRRIPQFISPKPPSSKR